MCVSEEEPSRRRKKKGRRRRGREEDGPTGTGPFAVIRLLKIVAFFALIFVYYFGLILDFLAFIFGMYPGLSAFHLLRKKTVSSFLLLFHMQK